MKVTLSWLREFAPDIAGDPVELGETLSALGLAVEDMQIIGETVDGVVLAKVLDLRPHPDADKIQLVDVDAGDGNPLQVCCGAFNMAVGDLIPFATIGTVMPNGMEIAQREMRGQTSNGMCCSGAEIGFGDDHDGILILNDRVVDGATLGMALGEALGIETDVLWELEVNANRPDAMSVAGVARDLAAALGVPFSFPTHDSPRSDETAADLVHVEIDDPSLCGRFVATVLRNVEVGSSPAWMQNRLTALGMRPINSIVDISNYVMLELGQPNHTFDLAAVPDGTLRVRRAEAGETLVTLDDVERTLAAGDGVITDRDGRIVSLAGVMGGASTEISGSTTDVLLEMAWWDPPSISRTVKHHNLPSEASTRFRRGADWGDNIDRAMARFIQLAADQGAIAVTGAVDVVGELPDRTPVPVRTAKVNGLLGTDLSADEMRAHLGSIGFGAELDGDDLSVTIPTSGAGTPSPRPTSRRKWPACTATRTSCAPCRRVSWPAASASTSRRAVSCARGARGRRLRRDPADAVRPAISGPPGSTRTASPHEPARGRGIGSAGPRCSWASSRRSPTTSRTAASTCGSSRSTTCTSRPSTVRCCPTSVSTSRWPLPGRTPRRPSLCSGCSSGRCAAQSAARGGVPTRHASHPLGGGGRGGAHPRPWG
ncbi:MAG: phenylalanine--tRNA ligase subunit beta [Acidimicrobiales bacterium]